MMMNNHLMSSVHLNWRCGVRITFLIVTLHCDGDEYLDDIIHTVTSHYNDCHSFMPYISKFFLASSASNIFKCSAFMEGITSETS